MSLAESDMPSNSTMSIGAVMTRLKPEFPEVSISKIRFLESEGLVTPHRTPSGTGSSARRTSSRLRYVLVAQRDQYLPLKVIKDQLDAIDRGTGAGHARGPAAASRLGRRRRPVTP